MTMDVDQEKNLANSVAQLENVNGKDSVSDDGEFTAAEVRAIMRRVDLRVVGVCALGYSVSLMDRTNLSYAAIAG